MAKDLMRSNTLINRRRGFTLVEVVCVCGILMSLAGLILPVMVRSKRAGYDIQCIGNLRQCYIGLQLYSADHNDVLAAGKDCADMLAPTTWPEPARSVIRARPLLSILLSDYCKDRRIWQCPLDNGWSALDTTPEIAVPSTSCLAMTCGMSYRYKTSMSLARFEWTSMEDPSSTLILSDQAGHWHAAVAPMPANASIGAALAKRSTFKYNVLLADGHTRKAVNYEQLDRWWGR